MVNVKALIQKDQEESDGVDRADERVLRLGIEACLMQDRGMMELCHSRGGVVCGKATVLEEASSG